MKNLILSVALMLMSFSANSQFVYRNVIDDFDGDYKISYSEDGYGNLLKLENLRGSIVMYITGTLICDEEPIADLIFYVNEEKFTYSLKCSISSDSKTIFIIDDLEKSVVFKYFLKANKLIVRVNQDSCENEYFMFSLGNSTKAFNFMK